MKAHVYLMFFLMSELNYKEIVFMNVFIKSNTDICKFIN